MESPSKKARVSPLPTLTLFLVLLSFLILSILIQFSNQVPEVHAAADSRLKHALQYFSREEITVAKQYRHARLTHWFNLQILTLSSLGFLLFSRGYLIAHRGASRMTQWMKKSDSSRSVLRRSLYAGLIFLVLGVLRFPEDFHGGFLIEHSFGLSDAPFRTWIAFFAKGALLDLGFGIGAFLLFLRLRERFGRRWPVAAALVSWAMASLMILIAPLVIDPLFHSFHKLEAGPLRTQLEALVEKAAVPVEEIWVMDASRLTKKTNAYFTGLGSTRRIVLYDTLIATHTDREIAGIMAHEIGHWKHHHVLRGLVLWLPGSLLFFVCLAWLIEQIAAREPFATVKPQEAVLLPLGLALALLCSFAAQPIANAVSRSFEREADQAALELTQDRQAFLDAEVKLIRQNRSDILPAPLTTFFFATHPAPLDRLTIGEQAALPEISLPR